MKQYISKFNSIATIAVIIIAFGALFSHCSMTTPSPLPSDDIRFFISKGQNFSTPRLNQTHFGINRISYYCQFDENCKYQLLTADSNDINKVYGFSYGAHQQNSSRLGWNWKSDTLKLYNYAYMSGNRRSRFVINVGRNVPVYVEQWYEGPDTIWVSCVQNGKAKAAFVTGKGIGKTPGTYLYPYFGGTSAAPNTMSIRVWGVRTY